jgi:hypothetical protein
VEWWVQDVAGSATYGPFYDPYSNEYDYATPEYGVTSGEFFTDAYGAYYLDFNTFKSTRFFELTESFEIHVRVRRHRSDSRDRPRDGFSTKTRRRMKTPRSNTSDYLNRLIGRCSTSDGGRAAATQQFFSHENGQVALQFDGPAASNLSHRYLWNPAAVDHSSPTRPSPRQRRRSVLWTSPTTSAPSMIFSPTTTTPSSTTATMTPSAT